jgi:hypothetical protein
VEVWKREIMSLRETLHILIYPGRALARNSTDSTQKNAKSYVVRQCARRYRARRQNGARCLRIETV